MVCKFHGSLALERPPIQPIPPPPPPSPPSSPPPPIFIALLPRSAPPPPPRGKNVPQAGPTLARSFVGISQKSIFKRPCQVLAMNALKMAARTTQWLQERPWNAPTKDLLWCRLSSRQLAPVWRWCSLRVFGVRERKFFIDNLLVRIHLIMSQMFFLVDRPRAMGV